LSGAAYMLIETSATIYYSSTAKQAAEKIDVSVAAWTALRDLKLADMTWD
jgi:hypothetical protein